MNIMTKVDYAKYRNLLRDSKADRLVDYLNCCQELDCDVYSCDLETYILNLHDVSLALDDEEAETMGLSKTARKLRKEWRSDYRKIKRALKATSRNKLQYYKEWSRPRAKYTFKCTNEVHNGLWYAVKAYVSYIIRFKYFHKVRRVKW